MGRYAGLIWTIGGAVVAFLLTQLLWPALIETSILVRPAGRVTLANWLADFRQLGTIGIGVCFVLGCFWWVMGEFVWKVVSGGIVALWYILAFLGLMAVIVPAIFNLPAAQSQYIAYGAYFLNFIAAFYVPTLFGSPDTVALVPPGSHLLRK
ncbi:MAG: hypothetical protein KME03_12010 [Aphanocapsa lilacina HA4352-LM1]|jgi:hypothetical protein|nr:hypothetical protein [Aphanocapsa lilacina HA4352-LM1]